MKMTVAMRDGSWKPEPKPPQTVTVELVRLTHIGSYELPEDDRRFSVVVNGASYGYIERSVESTDRHYGLIRVPGRGRPAWQWYREADGKRSQPGLHEPNRAAAIAHVFGYEFGEQVK